MKKTIIASLIIALVGIVFVQSLWLRAPDADRIPAVFPIEPIENLLPTRAATRPVLRDPAKSGPLAKVLAKVDYKEKPLWAVFEDLRTQTGANLDIRWNDLNAAGVESTTSVTFQGHNLPAARILSLILEQIANPTKLAFRVNEDDVVMITRAQVINEIAVVRAYNIRDILYSSIRFHQSITSPGGVAGKTTRSIGDILDNTIKELQELIQETVDHESWINNGGKTGMIRYINGKFIVTQTDENHAEIEKLLQKIRER